MASDYEKSDLCLLCKSWLNGNIYYSMRAYFYTFYTYLLTVNIDIHITIFCHYRYVIEIVK